MFAPPPPVGALSVTRRASSPSSKSSSVRSSTMAPWVRPFAMVRVPPVSAAARPEGVEMS